MIRVHPITRQPATDLHVRRADFCWAMRGINRGDMHAAGIGGGIAT